MTLRLKGWFLAGSIVVWAAMLAMRVATYEEPLRVPLTHRSGQALVKSERQPTPTVPSLARMSPPPEDPQTLHQPKNIFAPLGRRIVDTGVHEQGTVQAAVRSGERVAAWPRHQSPMDAAIEQVRTQQDQQAMQARQRMAQYRFIGYVSQDGEPRAFLGKGTHLYIVRPGEVLEGQIRVAAIGATSLKLRDAASEAESALQLSRQGEFSGPTGIMVPGLTPGGVPHDEQP